MSEKVAVLDCGGQYTKVIDRKVRELGVNTDIFPLGTEIDKIKDFSAIILSGGPSSVWEDAAPSYDRGIFDLGIPVLGICYGMQLICEHFGGEVKPELKTEYGQVTVNVDPECPLFDGLLKNQTVLMSHGDAVSRIADGFTSVGVTADITDDIIVALYNKDKNIAGVQFHPEVDLTENGLVMLENFLRKMCKLKEVYALDDRIEKSVEMIKNRVGNKKVLVLVSGGVDSAVTAALLVKALPAENVYALHIDHGLMRKNESDAICENLGELGLVNMLRVNAEDAFFNDRAEISGDGGDDSTNLMKPLSDTYDPEMKRQIIGSMFIKVTREAAEGLGLDFDSTFLAQGTLRPDLIESGNPDVSGYAHKIKTHHNDVDIVRRAREKGLIIETNWDWHKDEVRRVARMLGLGEDIASRQPFPGPGLGVRLICSDGRDVSIDEEKSRELDTFMALSACGIKAEILPISSVGVQGDNRSYKNLALLYGKDAHDADWNEIFETARRIPNEFPYINRCAYLLNKTAPDCDIRCGEMHICREIAELLREIDAIVTDEIMNPGISQCFAVLMPVSSGGGRKYTAAIRAVVTTDFMTAKPAKPDIDFPLDKLIKASDRIISEFGDIVDMVVYDCTGKPPATVEWE